jgi:predicted transcriptional regulator
MAVDRKKSGVSKRYQYKFREIPVESMDVFSEDMALHNKENISSAQKQKQKANILEAIFNIADEQLTQRQKDILYCRYVLGMTQVEIGKKLGITQSCVSLQINGIPNYTYNKIHGGVLPKLRKMCINEAAIASGSATSEEVDVLLKTIKSRIKKSHPDYSDLELAKKAVESFSNMSKILDLFEMLIKEEVEQEEEDLNQD